MTIRKGKCRGGKAITLIAGPEADCHDQQLSLKRAGPAKEKFVEGEGGGPVLNSGNTAAGGETNQRGINAFT